MPDPLTSLSKRLAYVLRHNPSAVGLDLDDTGWVDLDELIAAMNRRGHHATRADIDRLLASASKQRFEVAGNRIRAAHGHSIPIELGLLPSPPPPTLYHGTMQRHLSAILERGRVVHDGPRGARLTAV
jgi:putative RNA 2'-phosphotransferase